MPPLSRIGAPPNALYDIQLAAAGTGPLLQRDYWAVIRNCRVRPSEVVEVVRERFVDFAPKELAHFRLADDSSDTINEGSVMDVKIRMVPEARVVVIHLDEHSLTIATLRGHPEAGKITFAAYPNRRGDVIFHIRSRARASSAANLAGFRIGGDPMQANTWTDFVDRVAHSVGDGVIRHIHAEKWKVKHEKVDADPSAPVLIARGS